MFLSSPITRTSGCSSTLSTEPSLEALSMTMISLIGVRFSSFSVRRRDSCRFRDKTIALTAGEELPWRSALAVGGGKNKSRPHLLSIGTPYPERAGRSHLYRVPPGHHVS